MPAEARQCFSGSVRPAGSVTTTVCAQPSVEDAGRSGGLAQPAKLKETSAAGIVIAQATLHDSGRDESGVRKGGSEWRHRPAVAASAVGTKFVVVVVFVQARCRGRSWGEGYPLRCVGISYILRCRKIGLGATRPFKSLILLGLLGLAQILLASHGKLGGRAGNSQHGVAT